MNSMRMPNTIFPPPSRPNISPFSLGNVCPMSRIGPQKFGEFCQKLKTNSPPSLFLIFPSISAFKKDCSRFLRFLKMQYFGVFPDNILPFWFIFAISIRWLIGIAGFLLNASLVYVTINSKSLREWCNLLIALNATFAGLFGLSLTAGFALILSGHSFIPQISCFQLQAFPLLFRNLGLNTLFFIALDRLICILFVSWDHHNWLYLCSVAGLSLSHGLFIVFSCLAISLENPFHPTLCSTHDDLYFGPFANTLLTVNVSVSLLILFAHVALWAVVRVRKNSANGPVIRRLLNSLMVMMGMLVGGFLANNLIQILYVFVVFSDPIKAHISVVMAWLPAMAFASNAPILIAFSTEYRKAYSRQFGPFLKLFRRQTSSMANTNQSMDRRNVSTIRVKSVRNVIGFM